VVCGNLTHTPENVFVYVIPYATATTHFYASWKIPIPPLEYAPNPLVKPSSLMMTNIKPVKDVVTGIGLER
jgi:hypothetical protein